MSPGNDLLPAAVRYVEALGMFSICRKIERRERDGQLQSLSVNEKDRVRAE